MSKGMPLFILGLIRNFFPGFLHLIQAFSATKAILWGQFRLHVKISARDGMNVLLNFAHKAACFSTRQAWNMNITLSGHHLRKKNIFMNSLALLDHTAVNSALYLSLIFIYKKGGAFLHALPFRHSRGSIFNSKFLN